MKKLLSLVQNNLHTIRTVFILTLTIQNGLSIVNIFTLPFPIPPRTTIGLMTGFSVLLIGILLVLLFYDHKSRKGKKLILTDIDIAIGLFVIFQAVSLLFSPEIYQSTTFRLLIIAVIQYAVFRLISFSSKEMKTFIVGLATTSVLLSIISVFQITFRQQAIAVAKQYFFGDAAYGLVWELSRGRAPHWGNLTISFPFLFSGIILLLKKPSIRSPLFIGAVLLLFFVFLISNFRWLTACFIIGSTLYISLSFNVKQIPFRFFIQTLLLTAGIVVLALVLSETTFHYNLVDRLFMRDTERDVNQALGRLYLYNQAIQVFTRSPILGIGLGNYPLVVEPIIGLEYAVPLEFKFSEISRQPISSHNELLTVLAEGGLISFMVFLYLNIAVSKRLWFVLKHKNLVFWKKNVVTTMFVSLWMYFCYGMFENISPNNYIYLFFLYGISLFF